MLLNYTLKNSYNGFMFYIYIKNIFFWFSITYFYNTYNICYMLFLYMFYVMFIYVMFMLTFNI